MAAVIEGYRLTRYEFPRERPIGDSQVRSDVYHLGTLEVYGSGGLVGLGCFASLFVPLPPLAELERVFAVEVAPALLGQNSVALTNRVSRPRGGNIRTSLFSRAVDQAIWDLQAKEAGLPLYKLLGGTRNRVPAYASGLDYHLSTEDVQDFFSRAAALGFTAFKIKVGHPDLAWDLARLRAITEVLPAGATLMVDANEAWSPKEAIRRALAFREAGFSIYWIEDPCLRDDFAGLALVAREIPFAHINAGEYLDLHGKRLLLEHRAVDILNVHGNVTDAMRGAWLAAEYGIPVSVGNTPWEFGAHIAAALPEPAWLEYSFQTARDQLVEQPIQFEGGHALLPDRPGHGLVLSEPARAAFARSESRV
jgi:L-alanine-DL-glutamate epimerase-like enolase superfamily enzyme